MLAFGDIMSTLLGFDPEPFPYRDPEYLEPEENEELCRASSLLCKSHSLYQQIRFPYDNASLITKQKLKQEREGAKIGAEELQNVLMRTSIHSLLKERNLTSKKNTSPISEVTESSIYVDLEDIDIPSEFKEQSIYKYHYITENDTLAGIALQYSTRISELKRMNNIHNNQDFFARESIRVPDKIQSSRNQQLTTEQQQILERFLEYTNCSDERLALTYLRKYAFQSKLAAQKLSLDAEKKKIS